MKLHLPVSLFAAVMAVISAMPTFADVTVKIGGEDWNGSWEQYEAAGDYIIDKDMEITLSGKDGQLTLPTDKSFVQRGDITIRITDGACLKGDVYNDDDGIAYQFGKLGTYGSGYTPTKKEYTANLIIDGGSASLSSGGAGVYNSVVFGELGLTGAENKDVRLHVNIDVKNGKLDISADRANCAFHSKVNGQADLTVAIGAGGTINFSAYENECYLTDPFVVLPSMGYNNTNATLTIQGGGTLNLGVASFGYYNGTYIPEDPCQLTVKVIGTGNHLNLHGGNIGLVSSIDYAVKGTITIDGGRLTMSDNTTRVAGTFSPSIAYADGEGTETMEMTIRHGGEMEMQTGKVGYARTIQDDGASTVTLNLKLEDTSSLTMGSGTIAGTEGDNSQVHAKITMAGDSRFTMEDGAIGKGKGVDLTINMEGGSLTASAGSIGEGAVSCELNLKGGSFTMEAGASFTGDINVHSGSLSLKGDSYKSTEEKHVSIQLDNPAGADLGGLDASLIKEDLSISAAGATLRGLKAGTTLTLGGEDNVITVGSGSVWTDEDSTVQEGKKALIEFQESEEKGRVSFTGDSTLSLNLVGDDFLKELLREPGKVSFQVYFTNGEITSASEDEDVKKYFKLGSGWGLRVEEYTMTKSGGVLTIKGETNIGLLSGREDDPTLEELSKNDAVIVTGEATLESTEGGTLRHLTGEGDLTITGSGKVELENEKDEFGFGDSELTGKLTTTGDVDLHKTGSENLTLSGGLEAKGDLTVDEGGLTINGVDNSIGGTLTVGGAEKGGTLDVQGNLDAKDVTVQNGKLTLTGDDNIIGGQLTLGEKGTLEVDGQLTLSGSVNEGSRGALTGNGTVILDGDIEFGNVKLGEDLTIQMGEHCGSVDFGDTPVTLPDLKGEEVQGDVTVTGDGEFSGSFAGKLTVQGQQDLLGTQNGNCDLLVEGPKGQVSLAAGSTYRSVTNGGDPAETDRRGGKLVIAADENGSKAGAGIKVNGDIVFRNGAETDFKLNLSDPNLWGSDKHDATMLSTEETIYIEKGTKFIIDCSRKGIVDAKGDLTHVVVLTGQTIKEVEKYEEPSAENEVAPVSLLEEVSEENGVAECSLPEEISFVETRVAEQPKEDRVDGAIVEGSALFNQLYESPTMWTNGKESWIEARHREMSPLAFYATTSNSRNGLNLLWHELSEKGLEQASEEVEELLTLLDNLVAVNPVEARRVMAAVAGSTLTSVSAAQSAALRNQMGRVRDHALQAARLRCAGNADEATAQKRPCKNSHVWVEGTSFFSEQHSVGDESGYRLNSWGGAVGIDAQVDAHWSVGVSLSASYGDLEAHAADDAKGDLDTYTVSFWSQAKNGRWGNTLLFTLGTNEADLKRTVNYGAGSYTATSNASGSSLGAMWELTYDFHPVKDNKSNILQPLFNVAVMHTSMDGFSEKNAGNVGLAAEKQTRDTITLGLGLRWLAAINSAKAVNRTVSTEVHANVAQDLGDRRSVANVALLADPNFTQSVYGSKTGSTAFQFGAGVNVPVTPNSQIYVNAGGELREHANAWNAALGVRMGF